MDISHHITSELVGTISVGTMIVYFVAALIYSKAKSISLPLHELLVRSLAASSIPTAIVILICSFDITLFFKLVGALQIYIALAGLSLAYVSFSAIFKQF